MRADDQLPAGDEEIRHGYTMASAARLATWAVTRHPWSHEYDFAGRLDAAWFAAVEHILTAHAPPPAADVIHAAWAAIRRYCNSEARFRGIRSPERRQRAGGYFAYWLGNDVLTGAPEDRVTDGLALAQIWRRMSERDRRLLEALAEHGNYGAAAAALGMRRHTYATDVGRARARFRALWHQGETPSRQWGADRRGQGDMPVTYRLVRRRRAAARRAGTDLDE